MRKIKKRNKVSIIILNFFKFAFKKLGYGDLDEFEKELKRIDSVTKTTNSIIDSIEIDRKHKSSSSIN